MFAVAPLALIGFATSADAHPTLEGSGKTATEIRAVGDFDAIASEAPFDVTVTVGPEAQVSITCDDNLLPRIDTHVRGGTLSIEIEGDRAVDPKGRCEATVSLPRLEGLSLAGSGAMTVHGVATLTSLSLAGSGDIDVKAVDAARLEVSLAGSGNILAAGKAETLSVSVAGSGDVRLAGVVAQDAIVSIAGSGDVTLTAQRQVEASITGSGDVEVTGSAAVHQSVIGSGSVRVRTPEAG